MQKCHRWATIHLMVDPLPALPRNFLRWEGPWFITVITGWDGTESFSETVWLRWYRERSHCGTDGCCEAVNPHFGGVIEIAA